MPAVAITDTNNMFGMLEFATLCAAGGVQPIPGLTVDIKYAGEIHPVVLIAQTESGYKNLMKLMTCFYIKNQEQPRFVTLEDLSRHSNGVIVLSGGFQGPAGDLIMHSNHEKAAQFLRDIHAIYGDRLYIEISRTNEPAESITERHFIEFAMQNGIPLVATNEVFFLDKSMHASHDILMCIADGTYVTVRDRKRVSKEHYLKSTPEMFELFSDVKEAVENTAIIARRCSFMPEKMAPILPSFISESSQDDEALIDKQAQEGLTRRLEGEVFSSVENANRPRKQVETEYAERLKYELDLIKKMKFSGYFLIVSDFVKWAKTMDIPVGPGRGSGAGSLVAWCLYITDLDPIKYNLIFERFLNPERISMPDFDIDFCQRGRDDVVCYVQSRYGRENVAHIIALGKLQARAVLRDVGRVIQMPYGQVDKISKLVPQNAENPIDLAQALEIEPQLRQMMDEDDSVTFLIETGLQLEGLYRHASLHAAGIVISNAPVDELAPLYSDGESELAITQFNMKYVESAGLIKFDFLGLKTLTVIQDTCKHIKRYKGIEIDISKISFEDEQTFKLLCSTDVTGVFQLESAGIRDVIQKLQPDCLEDIIALISLYRPGPMDNIPLYIARKHGKEKVKYPHPLLESILSATYGIMIYQEQVMKTAQEMGGYSLASADILRRAMGKKNKTEMEKNKKIFIEGAAKNSISSSVAGQVFALMEKFAGYGFNRSHAAGYAVISYQTAYLKANHRREFLIASMNMDIANTDKLFGYIQDAKKCDIEIFLPDINLSEEYFVGEGDNAIRYALGSLKGCGVTAMRNIVTERKNNGKFKDIFDFYRRISSLGLTTRQIESLILAGAFDSMHPNRRQLMESQEALMLLSRDCMTKQRTLFSDHSADVVDLKDVQEWETITKLDFERQAVGFYISAHPMDIYIGSLRKFNITKSRDFAISGDSITVAGVLLSKMEKLSRNGQKYAYLAISDQDSIFEAMIFPEPYARFRDQLIVGSPIIVDIAKRVEAGATKFIANAVKNVDEAIENQRIYICVDETSDIDALYETLASIEDGGNAISFLVMGQSGEVTEVETRYSKRLTAENRRAILQVRGVRFWE
jgi:DNA polymerase-3 subunit alpha